MTSYVFMRPPWGCFNYICTLGLKRNLYSNSELFRKYGTLTGNLKRQNYLGCKINSLVFYSDLKKSNFELHKASKSSEIIQDVLQKNKTKLKEKRDVFVEDIRKTKTKVKEKMEEVIERENVLTIPNLLCVGRAFLAPYLGYVIVQQDFTFAMVLLIAAGVSDLVNILI